MTLAAGFRRYVHGRRRPFRLGDRILKLGMIWQWKANKGSPYAEDLGNYSVAIDTVAGADKPAPIFIGRQPISLAARVAYPWPVPTS